MSKKLYVAKTGSDFAKGSEDEPLLTINKAASLALPGDTVIVHEGVYREEINDINSGLSESRRITFESAKNEKVTIKGSEEINDWHLVEGNIWKVEVPNQLFKTFNPFSVKLFGDWLEVDNNQTLG